jgi:hypothetical protein
MSHSANACLFAARHQNAALVILKQVLITPLRADTHWPNLFKFNMIGAFDKHQLSVAALVNGTTITCELRLDLMLIRSPECDILSRRGNKIAMAETRTHLDVGNAYLGTVVAIQYAKFAAFFSS